MMLPVPLIPANAGTQIQSPHSKFVLKVLRSGGWVPAFAGMSGF
ncbi:MAG: hypothetical protein JWR84_2183 [Caulobacter sp.]|nr:hypothetical protein [Caulobacter sp.]